jgi:hypothetical protein
MTEILYLKTDSIRPSVENWEIYRRPEADQDMESLKQSIREYGIQQPIIVSSDYYILSGHRRHAAAKSNGMACVPCVRSHVCMGELQMTDRIKILIEHNKGTRTKTAGELIAESMVGLDTQKAVAEIQRRKSQVYTMAQTLPDRVVVTTEGNRRNDPRQHRGEFLSAVINILVALGERNMLPTSSRHIHYKLLPLAPRTSKGKRGHPYGTDPKNDSGSLSKLITDARSFGIIPHDWIADETRGGVSYDHSGSIGDYVRESAADLFGNYFYDIHEDQAVHLELIVEKNTMFELIRKHISAPLRIPLYSGRGYASFPVGYGIKQRFLKSGKDRLVVISINDHDPDGYDMPQAIKKYLEVDHDIDAEVIRAAITTEQIERFSLPPCTDAKETSSRFRNYVKHTGATEAWELDSLDPEVLIQEIKKTCLSLLDTEKLNLALKREHDADVKLFKLRSAVAAQIPDLMRAIETQGGQDA